MDYQEKLNSLHQEIISTLCSIRNFPEGLLPFYVFVEEETEWSLECGNTVYSPYNLTAVFADGTCLLKKPGTELEEKRTLNEICMDRLAKLWNIYRFLSD